MYMYLFTVIGNIYAALDFSDDNTVYGITV